MPPNTRRPLMAADNALRPPAASREGKYHFGGVSAWPDCREINDVGCYPADLNRNLAAIGQELPDFERSLVYGRQRNKGGSAPPEPAGTRHELRNHAEVQPAARAADRGRDQPGSATPRRGPSHPRTTPRRARVQ